MKRVTPKKHLGQHFLKDENIAKKIVELLSVNQEDVILEVGPGTGVLTKYLLQYPNFKAWDVDNESIDHLKTVYPQYQDQFLLQDFLGVDLSQIASEVHVIGNFPYNISSQLFFQIYDHRQCVDQVVCMVQKEVADRIASKHGNKVYGILSVLLQAFYHVKIAFTVPPGVFLPPPKVNSAVMVMKRNDVSSLDCNEQLFKRVVKAGFGQRRKTLRNALSVLNLPKSLIEDEVFSKRAEQLSVQEFINLTQRIEHHHGGNHHV